MKNLVPLLDIPPGGSLAYECFGSEYPASSCVEEMEADLPRPKKHRLCPRCKRPEVGRNGLRTLLQTHWSYCWHCFESERLERQWLNDQEKKELLDKTLSVKQIVEIQKAYEVKARKLREWRFPAPKKLPRLPPPPPAYRPSPPHKFVERDYGDRAIYAIQVLGITNQEELTEYLQK